MRTKAPREDRGLAISDMHIEFATPPGADGPPPSSRPPVSGLVVAVVAALMVTGAVAYMVGRGETGEVATVTSSLPPATTASTTTPTAPATTAPAPVPEVAGVSLRLSLQEWEPPAGVVVHRNLDQAVDVAADDAGWVWTAGPGGIVRWELDGGGHTAFSSEDGLPAAAFEHVEVAVTGEVWVAAEGHVSRWDGVEWINYRPTAPGGGPLSVLGIAAGPDGSLWLLASEDQPGGGTLLLRARRGVGYRQEVETVEVPRTLEPHGLAADSEGRVWVASAETVWTWDGVAWADSGFPGGMAGQVFTAPDGSVRALAWDRLYRMGEYGWVPASGPVATEDPDLVNLVPLAAAVSPDGPSWILQVSLPWYVWSVPEPGEGITWILTSTAGPRVLRSEPAAITTWWQEGGEMAVAGDGSIWTVDPSGVHRYDGDDWQPMAVSPHAVPVGVEDAAVAGDRAWVLAGDGIVATDGASWEWHELPAAATSPWPPLHPRTLTVAEDGTLWFATGDLVWHRTEGDWSLMPPTGSALYQSSVHAGADGTVWLAGVGRLAHYDGGAWELYEMEGGLTELATQVVAAPDGGVWVAYEVRGPDSSGMRVSHFDGEHWSLLLEGFDVQVLAGGEDGSLWAAGADGVMQWRDGAWTRHLTGLTPVSLAVDSDGTVWTQTFPDPESGNSAGVGTVWTFGGESWRPVFNETRALLLAAGDSVWALADGAAYQLTPGAAGS